MISQKKWILLTVGLWLLLLVLVLVCVPIRWELAHSYAHLIKDTGNELPALTIKLGLPLLGIAYSGVGSIFISLAIWLILWGGILFILFKLARASTTEQIRDIMVIQGGFYGSIVVIISILFIFSLWLPFSLI